VKGEKLEVRNSPEFMGHQGRTFLSHFDNMSFVILSQYFAVYPLGISVYQPFPLETA
jgi:hypothetical protein